MHLFADISSHGFGHLAIAAPVLNALARRRPDLRLTLRTRLPAGILRQRIGHAFELIEAASDFGFRMHDALAIDREASATDYRAAHTDWTARVAEEAIFLDRLKPDAVLANVAYLPLAGAAAAGIPAAAICSLNWADLFAHFFGSEAWAASIHTQMLAAYRTADVFLRITPGMPMSSLHNVQSIGPIAASGQRYDLGLGAGIRAVVLAFGGVAHRLPVENWPRLPGIRWLVPQSWGCTHPDALPIDGFGLSFTDLLHSADAVLTKPGYGTFTEAVCNGTPVLYQRRIDWPEQDCLIEWLTREGNAREVTAEELTGPGMARALAELWAQPQKPPVVATGAEEAAGILLA